MYVLDKIIFILSNFIGFCIYFYTSQIMHFYKIRVKMRIKQKITIWGIYSITFLHFCSYLKNYFLNRVFKILQNETFLMNVRWESCSSTCGSHVFHFFKTVLVDSNPVTSTEYFDWKTFSCFETDVSVSRESFFFFFNKCLDIHLAVGEQYPVTMFNSFWHFLLSKIMTRRINE